MAASAMGTYTPTTDQMHRVPVVARRLGMSDDWVRRYFATVPGVKTIVSPTRRGRRGYSILLIPESVLAGVLAKFGDDGA
jgi:hypothetical protein